MSTFTIKTDADLDDIIEAVTSGENETADQVHVIIKICESLGSWFHDVETRWHQGMEEGTRDVELGFRRKLRERIAVVLADGYQPGKRGPK